ncbi:tripartite tricarboxylate transporter TctB family protein [uncultured Alsobacter sp.]|uniref:tripartite tricarboxylate transporter TctB family protein n=1 Tax=uncultured Alsobacter sp. TaxID=1748258 RepID=UPI0025FED811|nr:tripartite tricarboxylate transporter TctB family protein [uncultured Alsobacter sp.]
MTTADRTWRPLGISCLALAAAAAWIASDYAVGTVTAMGPGFIPLVVAAFLFLMGVLILVARGNDVAAEDADEGEDPATEPPALAPFGAIRPIGAILASIVAFGLAIKPLGLALTTFLVVLIGVYANRSARLVPALLLALGLSAGACLLFVTLLSLQIGLFPRFE